MNPENRRYFLRNRHLGQQQAERRDIVHEGGNLQTADIQQPPAEQPPTIQPLAVLETIDMYQPTGLQLEKFAWDDQVDGKSWLEWFERYCTFHKPDEGQQLLTMSFYMTPHAV